MEVRYDNRKDSILCSANQKRPTLPLSRWTGFNQGLLWSATNRKASSSFKRAPKKKGRDTSFNREPSKPGFGFSAPHTK